MAGDLRSELRNKLPEMVAEAALSRKMQRVRLEAIAEKLNRERVAPTRATGSPGRYSGGQALQLDRHGDGTVTPRGIDSRGRDWTVRVAAEPVAPSGHNRWDSPPPAEGPLPHSTLDLAGKSYGRLTVMRYHGRRKNRGGGALWLVRCVCGAYEMRSTKALYGDGPDKACGVCRYEEYIRDRAKDAAKKERRGDVADFFDSLAEAERRKVAGHSQT